MSDQKPLPQTEFQRKLSRRPLYLPEDLRELIASYFPVVDGRLQGLRIFTNQAQTWFKDISLDDLAEHVPDLPQRPNKRKYGFAIAEESTGVITTLDAAKYSYVPFLRRRK